MKDWWNDVSSGKPIYFQKCLSLHHFIHHKTHMESSPLAKFTIRNSLISGDFKARLHDLYPYYMYETCLAKVFLIRCFNAILGKFFAREAVGVTEGLLDP